MTTSGRDAPRREDPGRGELADVTVLAPFVSLMVSIARPREAGDGEGPEAPPPRTEVTFHAGGQGYWIANMAAELGAATRVCCPVGGRSGDMVRALLTDELANVVGIPAHRSNAVWISEGPDGEPATVAETPPPPLDRHEVDDLCNEMLAWGLRGGVAALAGVPMPGMVEGDVYARLTADLVQNGVRVVADVSPELVREVARAGASVVKVSHEELIRAGLAGDASEDAQLAAGRELRALGARAVLISRAERPALALTPSGDVRLRPPRGGSPA
jgi:1-phosphofructokinase